MNNYTTLRLARAYHFAAVKHVDTRRKGEAEEPYMNHLTEVAELVATAVDGADIDLIIAAVLHDTVEDTQTTIGVIENLLFDDIRGLSCLVHLAHRDACPTEFTALVKPRRR